MGLVTARDHVSSCSIHRKLLRTGKITPDRSRHSFDLIARIGMLRYMQHKQVAEICDDLRNLRLPARTVSWLSRFFLSYVIAVHLDSAQSIRSILTRNGGYALMLDGTGQHGPMVMQMRDAWSGMHLMACSVRSENDAEITPHLLRLKDMFGDPVASVRDLGTGVTKALKKAFPDTYAIACHFHFLRAEAWKLFEPIYPRFRSQIERRGLKKRLRYLMRTIDRGGYKGQDASHALDLCRYIFDYGKDAHGLSYPFSLPALDFYLRCENVREELAFCVDMDGERRGKPLRRLLVLINRLHPSSGPAIEDQAEMLIQRREWFNRIRSVLRYRNGPVPLNTQHKLSENGLEKGKKKLDWLVSRIDRELMEKGKDVKLRRTLRSMRSDLVERRDELFAPNVLVFAKGKARVRSLPRTISTTESEFRKLRRHNRRIKGNAHVDSEVQAEGVAMLILENLKNHAYVKAVYGSLSNLPKRFAMVSKDSLERAKKLQRPIER